MEKDDKVRSSVEGSKQRSPDKSKSKKISESSLDKVDPKDMKITLHSSKSDDRSL